MNVIPILHCLGFPLLVSEPVNVSCPPRVLAVVTQKTYMASYHLVVVIQRIAWGDSITSTTFCWLKPTGSFQITPFQALPSQRKIWAKLTECLEKIYHHPILRNFLLEFNYDILEGGLIGWCTTLLTTNRFLDVLFCWFAEESEGIKNISAI